MFLDPAPQGGLLKKIKQKNPKNAYCKFCTTFFSKIFLSVINNNIVHLLEKFQLGVPYGYGITDVFLSCFLPTGGVSGPRIANWRKTSTVDEFKHIFYHNSHVYRDAYPLPGAQPGGAMGAIAPPP